jgi:hypothetical protein
MKKSLKSLIISLVISCFIAFAYTSTAQEPPHPPTEKGTEYNHGPANGAPVGGGVYILLVLAAAYGAYQMYRTRSRESVTE